MQILNIFHVLVAIALVGFVLIQKGQGATAGASFGAGASATVFGSRGASNFLTRATWVLAGLFCAISLTMAVVVSRTVGAPETDLGIMGETPAQAQSAEDGGETGAEDGSDVPTGAELSVSAQEDSPSDVPAFETPPDVDAIEGSEVREAVESVEEAADDAATGDEGGEGSDSGR